MNHIEELKQARELMRVIFEENIGDVNITDYTATANDAIRELIFQLRMKEFNNE